MEAPGHADLRLDFEADVSFLPELKGEPTKDQATAISNLAAMFIAVPWGSMLPDTTFEMLRVSPGFVHSMVGDRMWEACWGDRHTHITAAHWVPHKLFNVLKWVVEMRAQKGLLPDLDSGKEMYKHIILENQRLRSQAQEPGANY